MALANTTLSVANFRDAVRVPAALGLDPRAANLLHAAVTSWPASLLPPGAHSHPNSARGWCCFVSHQWACGAVVCVWLRTMQLAVVLLCS